MELTVAIGVMSILGIIFVNTLTQTLRGQNKVKILNKVKQNGQTVLDRLSSEIRQSETIICPKVPATSENSIVVFSKGNYTRFKLNPEAADANGYITQNIFTADDIPDGVENSTLCQPTASDLGGTGRNYSLTDNDPVSGVSIRNATDSAGLTKKLFVMETASPGYSDAVNIQFRAFSGVRGGQTYETAVGPDGILFATTVQVRGGK